MEEEIKKQIEEILYPVMLIEHPKNQEVIEELLQYIIRLINEHSA